MKIHPNEQALEELLLSLNDRQRSVVQHLGWCGTCRSRLVYLPRPQPSETEAPASYENAALAESRRAVSAWQAAMERERDEAPGLFMELLGQPAGDRDRLVDEQPRFQTWGVYELLVERSLESTPRDPEFGEQLGLLALRLAGHLDSERYGAERITDLQARAWAFVGNACRLRFDFEGAEEAFGRSYSLLKKGTRDGLERAIHLDLKASLRRAQRRFDEALSLLRRAIDLFLSYGERHRAGRSLMNISIVHYHAGDPEAAVPVLHQCLPMLDPERDPRLLLCARHNLIFYLAEARTLSGGPAALS